MQKEYQVCELKINTSRTWTDRLILHRCSSGMVKVSFQEDICGTTQILAYYTPEKNTWGGYNPKNYDDFFKLIKANPYLTKKIIRFLNTPEHVPNINTIKKYINSLQRRINIYFQKLTQHPLYSIFYIQLCAGLNINTKFNLRTK